MSNYLFLRLPSEILFKILSYLDASSLFCISHVSKLFHCLSNDDAVWQKKYASEFGMSKRWYPSGVDELMHKMGKLEVRDRTAGYWKRRYFRAVAGFNMEKWKKELRVLSPYTGLPVRTAWVLRNLPLGGHQVTWELTVTDKSGREGTFVQSQVHFFESSMVLCWRRGCWPKYYLLSTLELHGVMKVALTCPGQERPGWRSLIVKCDVKTHGHILGQDRLIRVILLQPGIAIGIWRGQGTIAFVMASLHFHKLVERSLVGTSICPYEPEDKAPFDDIDPEYGLHGYSLHIVLHNSATEIMSGRFPELSCRKYQIYGGKVRLTAISRIKMMQHTPLSGNIGLPWACEALEGTVENCCMMSLTLVAETGKPFWCISSPVSITLAKQPMSHDYDGEHFQMQYSDGDGQVKMDLVWMEEQKQFFVVNLTVYVAVCKVNKHFGRDY
ncbi:F-box only protein 15 [Diretmus argenteus]